MPPASKPKNKPSKQEMQKRRAQSAKDRAANALRLAAPILGPKVRRELQLVRKGRYAKTQSVEGIIRGLSSVAPIAAAVSSAAPFATRAVNSIVRGVGSVYRNVKRQFATASQQYNYGFTDRGSCARGPGDGRYATFVIPYTSVTYLTINNAVPQPSDSGFNYNTLSDSGMGDATAPATAGFYGSFPSAGAAINVLCTDASNSFTVAAMPHMPRGYGQFNTVAAGPRPEIANVWASGFVCSGSIVNDQVMYSTTQYAFNNDSEGAEPVAAEYDPSYMAPMSSYDLNPSLYIDPAVNIATVGESLNSVLLDLPVHRMIPHRTVHLSMEIECTYKVIDTTGSCTIGTTAPVYGVQPEQYFTDTLTLNFNQTIGRGNYPTSGITMGASVPGMGPDEQIFTSDVYSDNRTDGGSVQAGDKWSVSFLPNGPHITNFKTTAAIYSAAYSNVSASGLPAPLSNLLTGGVANQAQPYVPTMGTMFMNIPCVYMTFSGVPNGCTFKVTTAWNVEYSVSNSGPLALLRSAAIVNKAFMPDFSEMPRCCAGGRGSVSCCRDAITCCHSIAMGFLAAKGLIPAEQGVKVNPSNFSIAPPKAAAVIATPNQNQVARILNTSPHMMGDGDRNAFHQVIQ